MGNRTDRGDAMILASCIVGILAGYIALFIDLPLPLLALSGIVSIVALGNACIAAAFRFAPERMAVLQSNQHHATFFPAGADQPEEPHPEPAPERSLPNSRTNQEPKYSMCTGSNHRLRTSSSPGRET